MLRHTLYRSFNFLMCLVLLLSYCCCRSCSAGGTIFDALFAILAFMAVLLIIALYVKVTPVFHSISTVHRHHRMLASAVSPDTPCPHADRDNDGSFVSLSLGAPRAWRYHLFCWLISSIITVVASGSERSWSRDQGQLAAGCLSVYVNATPYTISLFQFPHVLGASSLLLLLP